MKYYIVHQSAEEISSCVIALSPKDYAIISNFLRQVAEHTEGYCGVCRIEDVPYDTKEAAQEVLDKYNDAEL